MIQNVVKMAGAEAPKKSELLKMLAGVVVGLGADMAITAILGGHMPPSTGWKKMMRSLGIFILAMKAGEEAETYFNKVFDEMKEALLEAKNEMDEAVTAEGSVE